uniref:SGF29 C-terminal domain-containing protein n=1 Tax=Haemonchus contortus TaxID=6289 RepID=A0A7I4Z276_HAECO
MASGENRRKMIEQFNRKNNTVPKEFEVGEAVYAQVWKASQFMWKEGTITRRSGKVIYEVNLSGRITRKHANKLSRRDAKAPSGYGDKSLLTYPRRSNWTTCGHDERKPPKLQVLLLKDDKPTKPRYHYVALQG